MTSDAMKQFIDYSSSAAGELEHYFGSYVSMAYLWLENGWTDRDFDGVRERFIQGMNTAIEKNAGPYGGITVEHLAELAKMAEGDWGNVETIRSLCRKYHEIKRTPFDEEKLFGSDDVSKQYNRE